MIKALGARYSPNWRQVALDNYARTRRIDIGKEGYAGWALFFSPCCGGHDGVNAFVLEYRGPDWPSVRMEFTYVDRGPGKKNANVTPRHVALHKALGMLLAVRRVSILY